MNTIRAAVGIIAISIVGLLFVGCQTTGPEFPDDTTAGGGNQGSNIEQGTRDVFQIGDPVTLSFTGGSDTMPDHTETIKGDGTITLPYIGTMAGSVKAAGKTPAALQKELQEIYNKYYRTVTVTVQPLQRYFHVLGEVMKSGPYVYLGPTDIIQAITAAGGFTDFADKKRVQLTRSGAQKPIIVNCIKALEDSKYDVMVFPGDTINVPRRKPFGVF